MTTESLSEFLYGVFRAYLDRKSQTAASELIPVSVNTQARRLDVVLGYLNAVGEMATEESLFRRFQQIKSESYAVAAMNTACSGRATNSPSFSKHYLSFLLNFSLVTKQGMGVIPTGLGRLLRNCRSYSSPEPAVAIAVRQLVAYIHFINDPLTTIICITHLANNKQTISEIANIFHSEALSILSRILEEDRSRLISKSSRLAKKQLASWTKPESYAEHLVSAKLHMLSDCGIVRRSERGRFTLVKPIKSFDPARNVADCSLRLQILEQLFEQPNTRPDPIKHLIWLRSAFSNRPQSIVPMSVAAASFVGFGIISPPYPYKLTETPISYNDAKIALRCHIGGARGQSYISILPK
jgi:hypothetical protein